MVSVVMYGLPFWDIKYDFYMYMIFNLLLNKQHLIIELIIKKTMHVNICLSNKMTLLFIIIT